MSPRLELTAAELAVWDAIVLALIQDGSATEAAARADAVIILRRERGPVAELRLICGERPAWGEDRCMLDPHHSGDHGNGRGRFWR